MTLRTPLPDPTLLALFGGVLAVLLAATAVGALLARRVASDAGRATVANLNARVRAWWVMCAVFALSTLVGPYGSVVLFGLLSLLALREFRSLLPATPKDRVWLTVPVVTLAILQYLLVATGWYGLYSILIPVYAFVLIPTLTAITGDTAAFLERTSTVQWALLACVYGVSHAPALLGLDIPGYGGRGAALLLFLVLVAQMSDVLQYVFGKLLGRTPIAPRVSPSKTWEGFVGGVGSATGLGAAIAWATPFTPGQAAAMAFAITLMGFAGGLTMSAVKRDRGVKDFGTLIEGHGGILDRIDSLCFSAPIFFHLTRYYFT